MTALDGETPDNGASRNVYKHSVEICNCSATERVTTWNLLGGDTSPHPDPHGRVCSQWCEVTRWERSHQESQRLP